MLNKLVLSVCLVLSSIVGNVGTIVRSFSCIQSTQILAKQISDQRLGWLFGNLCCFIYCKHCRFNSRPLFSSCGQQLRLFGKFLPIHSYYCLFFHFALNVFLCVQIFRTKRSIPQIEIIREQTFLHIEHLVRIYF